MTYDYLIVYCPLIKDIVVYNTTLNNI